MAIATVNPATGEVLQTFSPMSGEMVQEILARSHQAFQQYRWTDLAQRSTWLNNAAQILEAEKIHWGKLITLEMGKTLKSAIAEVEKSALVCRYYAENASKFLADTSIATDASSSFLRYQPLGIILAVMPWNFPFWQVFRFAAPTMMVGNGGLLKHASNVPQCALAIQEIMERAGFPAGVFQTLLVEGSQVLPLLDDPRIKGATLTGSEPAGAALAAAAGKNLKKTVLELGGSDPFIVLPKADLEAAVAGAVTARLISNGQSCIAAKRFILVGSIAAPFLEKFVAKFQALQMGDPLLDTTDVGPLATPGIVQELDTLVQKCVDLGAKALVGGKLTSDRPGNFYPPTILTDLPPGCPAYQEEFFGPVALVFQVPDLEAAIALANSTKFGLGASAWTQDTREQNRLINELEAGSVFINSIVKSDPRLPFGGIKSSGYGRELSHQGLLEFANIKTVWMNSEQ
ncbi:MAG: NAD-dependent succinate-semialdehyde dehydrogenase [Coleofasciculaceae cyanobacterium SM2_1_6]|nr:NAD-dependent succinate-semialdehyde dehydrogenase [Coleofasciculaceae cyanobacterium SM2_1_6]